jgi:HEPN domain-containing protein
MSLEHQRGESRRWLRQAEDDISAVVVLLEHAKYSQACFLSQQAGEKAMKAVWYWQGREPWGHSIAKLIDDLPGEETRIALVAFREDAVALDKLYIPTRYPNGLPELLPAEAFEKGDGARALQCAKNLIKTAGDLTKVGE